MSTVYDVGDLVRVTAAFTDVDGAAVDPTIVKLQVRSRLISAVYTDAVQDGTGLFHRDVPVDCSGVWYYRWTGIGAVEAGGEGAFQVKSTMF